MISARRHAALIRQCNTIVFNLRNQTLGALPGLTAALTTQARIDLMSVPAHGNRRARSGPLRVPMGADTETDTAQRLAKAAIEGDFSRASNTFKPSSPFVLDPQGKEALNALNPPGEPVNTDTFPFKPTNQDMAPFTLERNLIDDYLHSHIRKAGGHSQWTHNHLLVLLTHGSPDLKSFLYSFLNDIANGRIENAALRAKLRTLRGIALTKPNSNKPRPIGIGEVLLQTACGVTALQFRDVLSSAAGEFNLGVGKPGGVEAYVHTVRTILEADPRKVAFQTDVSNAFNTVSRYEVLHGCARYAPRIFKLASWLLDSETSITFTDFSNGPTRDSTLTLSVSSGVVQGNPLSTALFGMAQRLALDDIRDAHPNVNIISIHDDTTITGYLSDVGPALDMMKSRFTNALNLSLNMSKTVVFSHIFHSTTVNDAALRTTISDYCNANNLKLNTQGIIVAGVPIGTKEYVKEKLTEMTTTFTADLDLICKADNYSTQGAGKKQGLISILRYVLIPRFTYLSRCLPPDVMADFCKTIDDAIANAIRKILRVSWEWDDTVLSRLRLPTRKGGMGIISLAQTSHSAFLGSFTLVAPTIRGLIPDTISDICDLEPGDPALPPSITALLNTIAFFNSKQVQGVAGMDHRSIWETSRVQYQHILSDQLADKIATQVYESYGRSTEVLKTLRAEFISGADGGAAAWLLPHRGIEFNKLQDRDFRLAYLKRLGSPLFDPATQGPCRRTPAQIVDAYGTHMRRNCLNMSGIRPGRHQRITKALIGSLEGIAKATREPFMDALCERIPPNPPVGAPANPPDDSLTEMRADAVFYFENNERIFIDTTVAPVHIVGKDTTADVRTVVRHKRTQYTSRYRFDPREFVVFGMDYTGHMAPEARDMIKGFARRAANKSGINSDHARMITSIYQRVGVALQSGNALMLSKLITGCGGHLTE
jgi:hypothetical protein